MLPDGPDELRRHLQANLADLDRREHRGDGRVPAAVCVIVVTGDTGPAVLLTRRASRLTDHPGQWALPGGRVDGDETDLDAAIREAHEEIGVVLDRHRLLGRLDDYPTRSGYAIAPFVFWGGDDLAPVPSPDEVASIHHIPLAELRRDDSPRFLTIPESDRPVIQLPIGDDVVHAPTGAVLYQFRAVALDGGTTRVHGYEQPVFAWR